MPCACVRRQGTRGTFRPRAQDQMIPIRADNPRRSWAVANGLLILLNIIVFAYQFSLPERASLALVTNFGVVPARAEHILTRPGAGVPLAAASLITSMFLHGGILHLLGNMLFLWVFGSGVEDRLGHLPYLLFYLL